MINLPFDLQTSIDFLVYYMDIIRINNIPVRYFLQGFFVIGIAVPLLRAVYVTLLSRINSGVGPSVGSDIFTEFRSSFGSKK